jgi:LysR family cys regulon transcriptional activator
MVTNVFSIPGRSPLSVNFERAGRCMTVVLTARDSDVNKTFVRLGLGVGMVAGMARTAEVYRDLVAIDGSRLLPEYVTWIGVRRGRLLRGYMYEFMRLFAPQLHRKVVDQALRARNGAAVEGIFEGVELPRY